MYTRRFFLVDNLSGRKDVSETPQQLQYASKIDLHINLLHDGQIYYPLLKVCFIFFNWTKRGVKSSEKIVFS